MSTAVPELQTTTRRRTLGPQAARWVLTLGLAGLFGVWVGGPESWASGGRQPLHAAVWLGSAALLIGAAAQLSQAQQSSAFAPPSPGQIAAHEIGRQLSQVSMETIRRNMDIRPTLRIEAGTPFYIFLGRDLVLNDPYTDQRLAERQP